MTKTVFILTSEQYICTEGELDCFHCLANALKLQENIKLVSTSTCNHINTFIPKQDIVHVGKEADLIILMYTNIPISDTSENVDKEPYFKYVKEINQPEKTIYIDYFEYSWMNRYEKGASLYHHYFMQHCSKYFKRECFVAFRMLPFPLSYFPKNKLPVQEKTIDIFCSFPSLCTGLRKEAVIICSKLSCEGYKVVIKSNCTKREYIDYIRKSYITLDSKGAGYINNRFLEIISNRSLCFRQKYHVLFYKDYIPGEEIVEYNSEEDLYNKLVEYLDNKNKIMEMEKKAYKRYNTYHTADNIGKYILDETINKK